MIYGIFFLVSLCASLIGSVCGIGGGIIIKPTLDAFRIMSAASISFLSGCTVLAMSMVSVYKITKNGDVKIQKRTGTPLAIGAAVGGVIGSQLFHRITDYAANPDMVGHVQSCIMVVMMVMILLYTLFSMKLRSFHVANRMCCILLGMLLGMLSAFLGIGGGPLNLAVLSVCFSMDIRQAAANSLYIILFSQSASLLVTVLGGNVPDFHLLSLVVMVAAGVLGAHMGRKLNGYLTGRQVRYLYLCVCIAILGLSIYNVSAI
ncbi:MAG: sulfite exporter TauE/SafE family protein [Lachnospiraceae bacterium]|nr:sulfite exporter TauE/SafE family protein [Lachnospiraceae bacterium]